MSALPVGRILFIDAEFWWIGQPLIQSVSENELLSFERPYIHTDTAGETSRQFYGFGYGAISIPEHTTKIRLLYAAGTLALETGIHIFLADAEAFKEVVLGFIVLIDATKIRTETSHYQPRAIDATNYLKTFTDLSNCLFVVLNADQPAAATLDEIAKLLIIKDASRLVVCEKQDKESAKKLLIQLLEGSETTLTNHHFIEAIKNL